MHATWSAPFIFPLAYIASNAAWLCDKSYGAAKGTGASGIVRPIEFSEAIYFSMVTLSTIGYGDIVPVTSLAQTFVMLEVMFGVVLLLFAFAEIASYDPDAEEDGGNE